MLLKTVEYDKKAFDYRDIFFVNAAGQEDKALASRYPTRVEWEEAMVEETKDFFEGIDINRNIPKNLEKIDAIAETIYTKVKRAVKIYNPVPLFMDVQGGQLGKTIEAHQIDGGKVYNRAYGGFMRISALRHVTYTVTTKPAAVHFQLPVEQLKTGRYSVADLVFAATQAILRYKISLAFDTFVAAYTTGSTGYVTNAGGALTKTVLNTAIDAVGDFDVDSITVVGRFSKLTPITDFTGFSDRTLDEIRSKGGIGTYRGADLVKLKYVADEVYDDEPFETSSIFLSSNEKSFNRYVEAKKLERASWIDYSDKTFHLTFDFEDGAAIWALKYGHRIYGVT